MSKEKFRMYVKHNLSGLGSLLSCQRDVHLFEGFNPDIEFTRTDTKMEGQPYCDFCLKLRKCEKMKTEDWITQNEQYLIQLSDDLYQHPEQALQEEHAAEMIAKELTTNGFTIEQNLGGLKTAFSATWGSGKPVIGFLGEYDALAGMSQKPGPCRVAPD
jgi:hypothetical protein